jgi:hydrogenase maturation factor
LQFSTPKSLIVLPDEEEESEWVLCAINTSVYETNLAVCGIAHRIDLETISKNNWAIEIDVTVGKYVLMYT